MSGDAEELEEGMAAERTSLAWNRTSLALLACGAAVVRGVPAAGGHGARPLAGTLIVLLAAAVWLRSAWCERRRRAAIAAGDLVAEASSLRASAVSAAAVGVVAFLLGALS